MEMDILAYGEDALTLWALTQKLPAILDALSDHSDPNKCRVLFRPSFGRSGGEHSSQFGEFDFMAWERKVFPSTRVTISKSCRWIMRKSPTKTSFGSQCR
jgi:hypothetical protein